jgi:DNA-directed RNA polymerase subunit RPC12/RpoP
VAVPGEPPVLETPPTPLAPGRIRFNFSCSRCGSILEATSDHSGRNGRCPTCGGLFVVPHADPHTGLARGPAQVTDDGQLPTPMHAYATAGTKAPVIRRLADGRDVIVCPRCGGQCDVEANACPKCGMPFTMDGATEAAVTAPESNGLATASLTIGVLSLPTFCLPILGVVAIGLGIAALKRAPALGPSGQGRGMAMTGIVCGILSLGSFLFGQLIYPLL